MKSNPVLTILIVAALVLGGILGYLFGKNLKPYIKIGSETTLVNVIVHDTVVTEKTVEDISSNKKVIYVPKYIYVDSSKQTDTIQVEDTSVCYSFEEYEKDGAYIKAEICSDSLPIVKPLDLRGILTYKAPPDTERHIMRIDTVMRTTNLPFYKDWKTYGLGLAVAIIAGIVIGGR